MNKVIQLIVLTGLFSSIGCATTHEVKKHSATDVYLSEVRAEELALTQLLYSNDADTARAARKAAAAHATD